MKAAAPTEEWCESHDYRLQATSQLRGQPSQRRIERAGLVWSQKRRLRRYVGDDRLRGADGDVRNILACGEDRRHRGSGRQLMGSDRPTHHVQHVPALLLLV